MQPVRPVAGARLPRRPSSAAGAVVLLALGAARPAFIEVVQARGGPCALVLAGALRIARDANGRLSVCTRIAGGRWRLAPAFADVPLLDPATLVDMALAQAIDACLHDLGPDWPLTAADRSYARRRMAADLYPDARGERTLRSLWIALVRGICDRELLRAASLVFGRTVRIADYNDMARAGAAVLTRITRETPNLAPLLGDPVRRLACAQAGAAGLGLLGELRRALMAPETSAPLARRDWKWLSRQSNSAVRGLFPTVPADAAFATDGLAIRLFAAVQSPLRSPRVPALVIGLAAPGGALARSLEVVRESANAGRFDDLARLVRLAVGEWRRRAAQGQSLRFMHDDLTYLLDWWIDQTRAGAAGIPANAGWAALVRRQQRWHQMIILRNPETLQLWSSAVAAHASAGYRIVPLTDSLMLAREGIEMRHCVAGHARDCAAGHARIFSLQCVADGARATVELRRRASYWFTGQVKGPCNAEVAPGMQMATERLAVRYARADAAR